MLKRIFKFLKSKTFFINLGIYIVFLVVFGWLLITWLNSYTGHGKVVKVPNFKGIKIAQLDEFIADKDVRYEVIDSVYDPKVPKGVVVRQEPEANDEVKSKRIIYLYVTSLLPPSIQMPKLIDRSLRQAVAMISTYGFKLGTISYVPDQCANCILDQLVKGKKIAPGANIPKGTVISLVVGKGLSDEKTAVPCLYGLTRKEAMEKLLDASLSVGALAFDDPKDTASAKVYKQLPGCGKNSSTNLGGSVDLFLTTDKGKISGLPADTTSSVKEDNNDDGTNFDN